MQNDLIRVFDFNENRVRTVAKDGEPWFCLKDVCDVLGLTNHKEVKVRLLKGVSSSDPLLDDVISNDPISKGIIQLDTPTNGGTQKVNFINETNLYKTIFQSRKPEAEKFIDWLAKDVIPSIRKTGGYLDSKTINLLSNKVENLEEVIKLMLEQQIELHDNDDDKIVAKGDIKNRARIFFVQKGYALADIVKMFDGKVSRKSLFNWRNAENWDDLRTEHENETKNIMIQLYEVFQNTISSAKRSATPSRAFAVHKIFLTIKGMEELNNLIPNTKEEVGLRLLTNKSS